ncbi:HEAT repeat domain-containing protein [Pseudanabaena sp. FACHB-1998]|uniref:HEAT repeat domain-containing protein n=1 Tax=Pseudanabaena sp. FACHB-1998 TaxID=2692858 RepID=UPI0016805CDA|nr:HEAT repeat domain-containing protein [Pseudanabaena sp. FACHB-1998]MBD2178007.1 HEAT repeat domain-containing protein [Pseudanabaena sp. FACHB-1998]
MNSDRQAQLAVLFRNGSMLDRKMILDELAQIPSAVAVPILQGFFTNSDFLCRRFAVMGLSSHRTDESFQFLQELLERETDDSVLAEIANTLFDFGDRAIALLQTLFERNQNWLTRQTILSVLVESDREDVLLNVIRLGILDSTLTVKETAILALGRLLDSKYEQETLDILAELSTADFWRDRWCAATILCLSSNPIAKTLLAQLRQDENHQVVAAALESKLNN